MNEILFEIMWMDLESILIRQVNKTEKHKYCTISLKCGIQIKNGTGELIYKTYRLTDMENKHMVTKGEGMDWEFGISR